MPAHASDTVAVAEPEPPSGVYVTATLPAAGPSPVTSWVVVPGSPPSPPPPVEAPPAAVVSPLGEGSGEGPPVAPPVLPPVVGQVSEGTQANCTSYAEAGARVSEAASRDGSGRPAAASPAACRAVPILVASAAPCGVATTLPGPTTTQPSAETLVTRNEP